MKETDIKGVENSLPLLKQMKKKVRKINSTLNCTLMTKHFVSWILNRLVLTLTTPFHASSFRVRTFHYISFHFVCLCSVDVNHIIICLTLDDFGIVVREMLFFFLWFHILSALPKCVHLMVMIFMRQIESASYVRFQRTVTIGTFDFASALTSSVSQCDI